MFPRAACGARVTEQRLHQDKGRGFTTLMGQGQEFRCGARADHAQHAARENLFPPPHAGAQMPYPHGFRADLANTCEAGHFLGLRSGPARLDKTPVEWKLCHSRDRKPCSIAMRRIDQPVSGTGNNGTWHT